MDTQLVRKVIYAGKALTENLGTLEERRPTERYTYEEWAQYASSDKYFVVVGNLQTLCHELGICEYVGITPNFDALPAQDGGINALVTEYTGIRANSKNKLNAVNLIKMVLDEYQTLADDGSREGWPVRRDCLSQRVSKFVAKGLKIYNMLDWSDPNIDKYTSDLSEATMSRFFALEAGITSARFPMPKEAREIINLYQEGEISLDAVIEKSREYWSMSLWE
jgi:hypothetical protein